MKAQDLRIGNWVDIKDLTHAPKTWQIEGVGNLIHVGGQLWSIEELEPIQLTEEWLERFGFDKLHGNWFDNGGVIELSEKDNGYVMLEDSYYHCSQDLLYVHQLQNLYHAITGEELEIKDTAISSKRVKVKQNKEIEDVIVEKADELNGDHITVYIEKTSTGYSAFYNNHEKLISSTGDTLIELLLNLSDATSMSED